MITPIATVVFAAAMALSLSVEAESFFHAPESSAGPNGAAEGEAAEGEATGPGSPDGPSLGP